MGSELFMPRKLRSGGTLPGGEVASSKSGSADQLKRDRWLEERTRNTGMECAQSDSVSKLRHGLSSSPPGWKGEPMSRLSEGQAILVVLLLSLGLWAVIWGMFLAAEYVLALLPRV